MPENQKFSILLTPGIFPPESGGPATFAPELGRKLVNRGHSVRVVTNGSASEGFDAQFPYEVVRISRDDNVILRYTKQVAILVQEMREFDPDVVLSNGFDFQAVTAANIVRKPIVTKIVGDQAWERSRRSKGITADIQSFQDGFYGVKPKIFKMLRSYQTRASDRVVVPSRFLQTIVSQWGIPEGDITMIHNSIDLDPPDVQRDQRETRIVTVGRLVNWKGIDGIIGAFSRIAEERPDLQLHIIGDGPERDVLEQQADETGYTDRIQFYGRIPHEQVIEEVARSMVFALNSTYEGLPHVALEAMACGTPVVLSNAGGNPEVIDDGISGDIFEQGDEVAMANRFRELLDQPNIWNYRRSAAIQRIENQFKPRLMVDKYVKLFGTITGAFQ